MTSTADLYDERGEDLQSCQTQFRQFGGRGEFHGAIVTVRCANDNGLVKRLLTTTDGRGRVLVVDGGASLASALMGDLIGKGAEGRGWEGVVINGPVRDSVERPSTWASRPWARTRASPRRTPSATST